MGFRNPITTAIDPTARATAAQALDVAQNGIIPGSRLAADAIDGKTITGATIRTAPAGQPRVELSSATAEKVELFTGDTGEVFPAQVFVTVDTTRNTALLLLRPPVIRAGVLQTAALNIEGPSRDGTNPGGWTLAGAGTVTAPISGPDTSAAALPLNGPAWVPFGTDPGNAPTTRLTASGAVHVEGIAALGAGGTFAPGFQSQVGTIPAGRRPDRLINRPVAILNAAGTWIATGFLQINTSGAVFVLNTSTTNLTAGYGFALGCTYRSV